MNQSMFFITYTKSFEVKPQFDRHFDSKSYRILLNATILLRRCFGLWASYVINCVKPSQFFSTVSTYDIMRSWQISWFSDFVCFFWNLKFIRPNVRGHVFWTKCSKILFISRVRPQNGLNNLNMISLAVQIWLKPKNSSKCNKLLKYSKQIEKYTKF